MHTPPTAWKKSRSIIRTVEVHDHVRWRRDQDVHMILPHNPFQNLDLEDFAGLPDQVSYA